MKTLICATLTLVLTSTGNSRQNDLPEFGDNWRVAPSPDPERFGVESGESLRFHGRLEIPFPASCTVFARTTYLVSPDSKLCLGFRRGKVKTDCLEFRYGFALFANGTRLVLAHHLAPSWNGDRGWTLQRTVRSGNGQPDLDQQTIFDLRDELIASYPTKFSMPTFFDNPENLTLELSSEGLQITRNGVSKTVACEISGEYDDSDVYLEVGALRLGRGTAMARSPQCVQTPDRRQQARDRRHQWGYH